MSRWPARGLLGFLSMMGMARCEPDNLDQRALDSIRKSSPVLPAKTMPALGLPAVPKWPSIPPTHWHTEPSDGLDSLIRSIWSKSRTGGRLGVSVYSTKYGRAEGGMNEKDDFTPASNLKLIVTAAVIDTFPVNYFPVTTLEVRGHLEGRTLHGALVAVGGGDPNVSNRFFPDALRPLKPFSDSLRLMGIDSLIGAVATVDTFFQGPLRPSAWKPHHFNTWYGAEVSSLSYQDNAFDITIMPSATMNAAPIALVEPDIGYVRVINKAKTVPGGKRRLYVNQGRDSTQITLTGTIGVKSGPLHMVLPVRHPPTYFKAALLKSLRQDSLAMVLDSTRFRADTLPLIRSFALTTAPLYDMIEEVNQRSQNLQAESLLRHLGRWVYHHASDTAGIRAEYHFLAKIGLDSNDFTLKDGCGLSSDNRVKPQAMAGLLSAMVKHPYVDDYIASLASPGLDGATGRRLRPWYQSNMIRYKTGSINRVQALSGYAFGIDGDTLAVATFLNDFPGSSETASKLLDTLFVHIASWFNKERESVIAAHKLMTRPGVPAQYRERLRYFSASLEGLPYFLGPTGEGRFASPDSKPIVDMSRFDCVTYIESVMGMSLAHSAREVLPVVKRLRYRGDTLAYTTRNHYFVADWLANNARYVKQVPVPGDTVAKRTINKVKFFQDKKLPAPKSDPVLDFRYLPYEKALELAKNWTLPPGFYGIAFATDIPGLDVTHTGFLIADAGKPVQLRHASQAIGHVATMDFAGYLESRRGKCSGIVVFEFLNP